MRCSHGGTAVDGMGEESEGLRAASTARASSEQRNDVAGPFKV